MILWAIQQVTSNIFRSRQKVKWILNHDNWHYEHNFINHLKTIHNSHKINIARLNYADFYSPIFPFGYYYRSNLYQHNLTDLKILLNNPSTNNRKRNSHEIQSFIFIFSLFIFPLAESRKFRRIKISFDK